MLEDLLVPITLFISIAIVLWKYIDGRNRENMAMIERGMAIAPQKPVNANRGQRFLTWGLLVIFVSVGMIAGLILTYEFGVVEEITPAIMMLCGGIALVANYGVLQMHRQREQRG